MPLVLMFEERDEYLVVRALGDLTFPELLRGIDAAATRMETSGRKRALIDMRSLSAPLLLIDHYDAAKRLAEHCQGKRLAVVSRKGQLEPFAMNYARDRGIDIVIATNVDNATDWLLGE